MAAVNYTVRLDENDKQIAERVFKELGLTMAAGLNVYIKMVVRQKRIPFDLALGSSKSTTTVTKEQREKAVMALAGLLAGYEVDLDKEREERILSK